MGQINMHVYLLVPGLYMCIYLGIKKEVFSV